MSASIRRRSSSGSGWEEWEGSFNSGFAAGNAIVVFMCVELMLNAANLNLIAFWRYGPHPEALTGMMFAIFSIAVAAAEAAVGLGLVISIYRHAKTTDLDAMNRMKG